MPVSPDAAPATDKPVAPATAPTKPAESPTTVISADAVDKPEGNATYTVAPGRTVSHGEGDKIRHYNPGDTLELGSDDAERLVELGFLLAPDGSVVVRAGGPATEGGVQISEPR